MTKQDNRPRRVNIGAVEYRVKWSRKRIRRHAKTQGDDTVQYWGATDLLNSVILINPEASEDQQRDTLLHEVLHAIAHTFHVQWCKDEERMIRRLTPLLLIVMQQNPKLSSYLFRGDF